MSYSPTQDMGSTIRAVGLNFRVRNGNGCFPNAIITERMLTSGVGNLRARMHVNRRDATFRGSKQDRLFVPVKINHMTKPHGGLVLVS